MHGRMLTSFQKDVYFEQKLNPDARLYSLLSSFKLPDVIDDKQLGVAVEQVITSIDMLNCVVDFIDNEEGLYFAHRLIPHQLLCKHYVVESEDELKKLEHKYKSWHYDLNNGPLFQAIFVTLNQSKYLLLAGHHLIADGHSFANIIRLICQNYDNFGSIKPSPIESLLQYQNKLLQPDTVAKSLTFLHEKQLSNFGGVLERTTKNTHDVELLVYPYSGIKWEQLYALSLKNNVSLYHLLLSSFALTVKRTFGVEIFSLGHVTHNRGNAVAKKFIGMMSSIFPVTFDLTGKHNIFELTEATASQLKQSYRYQKLPLSLLLRKADIKTKPFDILFNYQKLDGDLTISGHSFESRIVSQHSTSLPLVVDIIELGGQNQVELRLRFDPYLISETLAKNLLALFEMTLDRLIQGQQTYSALTIPCQNMLSISPPSLSLTNEPKLNENVWALLAQNVKANATSIAVIDSNKNYSYQDIDSLVLSAAQHLSNLYPAQSLIGVHYERGIKQIVGMLACFRANMIFVPMDPGQENKRLHAIDGSISMAVILSDSWSLSATPALNYKILTAPVSCEQASPIYTATQSDSAFVIFTSGTTNKPKAVDMSHRGLLALILGQKEHCELLAKPSVCLQFTSINFDVAIQEILTTLHAGGTLVCTTEQQRTSLDSLVSLLQTENVEMAFLPNTVLQQVLSFCVEQKIRIPSLSLIVTAGEALVISDKIKRFFSSHKKCRLLNHYGPTETHVATGYILPLDINNWPERPAIGTPLAYVQVALYNGLGDVTLKGGIGELYIFGEGLANGYLNQTELTQDKFVKNCLPENVRGYKTGDLCAYYQNENLEFIARDKNQVKVNGIRIDIDEIARLVSPLVEHKPLVILQTKRAGQLVVAVEGDELDPENVLAQLTLKLPRYMCPVAVKFFSKFPTTHNGKLDTSALHSIFNQESTISISHLDGVEFSDIYRCLQKCWQQALAIDDIAPTDDFFLLGGHSMTATRLVKLIADNICRDITLVHIFNQSIFIEQYHLIVSLLSKKHDALGKLFANAQQEALYRYQLLNPQSCQYNMTCTYRLQDEISMGALQQALMLTLQKHKILCSRFVEEDERLSIAPCSELNFWHYEKVTDLGSAINKFVTLPFNLNADLPTRVHVYESEEEIVLAVSFHHIVMDGGSLSHFKKEVDCFYQDIILGKEIRKNQAPFEYINLHYQTSERHLAHWGKRLSDMSGNVSLPTEYRLAQVNAAKYRDNQVTELLSSFRMLSKQYACSTALVFEVIIAMISRYMCDQSHINIGVPFPLSPPNSSETEIGYFVNTLPIVYRIEDSQLVEHLFKEANEHRREDFSYADIDVSTINVPNNSQGLFQIFVQWLKEDPTIFSLHETKLVVFQEPEVCRFDLSYSFVEDELDSFIQVDYDAGKYSELYISQFIERIKAVVPQLIRSSSSQTRVDEIDFLLPHERQCIFSQQTSRPLFEHVVSRFNEIAVQYAECEAISFDGKSYNYQWVLSQVSRVSSILRDRKLPLGSHVVVALPREPMAIVCQLAIWQCGLVYVPLQSHFPKERLLSILNQVEPVLVINSGDWLYGYPELLISEGSVDLIPFEQEFNALYCEVAYLLFTSGSTGTPKGVAVKHTGLASLLSGLISTFDVNAKDIMPSLGDLTFGVAFVECLLPLMSGGQCVIVPRNIQTNVEELLPLLGSCTLIHLIPSLARVIAQHPLANRLEAVRYVFVGGDALNCALVEELQGLFYWAKIVEFYGQTEGTVLTTFCPSEQMKNQQPNSNILGGSLPHAKVWILNKNAKPVPFGVIGDMYISGDGVAKGYLNDEHRTQSSFVALPNIEPGIFLKTGDRAKYTQTGLIQYLGRKDFQINLNGYRIEPAEIEVALKAVSGSQVCVVKWFEEQQILVGFYLKGDIAQKNIALGLKNYLPEYMLPHRLVALEEFPLNRNNKIDRNALTLPQSVTVDKSIEAVDFIQQQLFELWSDIFNQDVNSLSASFFDTGAHSLKATAFVTKFNQKFNTLLSLKTFFELAEIGKLYQFITKNHHEQASELTITPKNIRRGEMSKAQQRIWLLHHFDATTPAYDKNVHLMFNELLDVDRLRMAFKLLLARHEVLRTIYPDSNTQQIQCIDISGIDFTAKLNSEEFEPTLTQAKARLSNMRFDLTHKAPFAVNILQNNGNNSTHILFKTHHIATDGVSMQLLAADLMAFYHGDNPNNPPINYLDYSEWQSEQVLSVADVEFWEQYIDGATFMHTLPTDYTRTSSQSTNQNQLTQVLNSKKASAMSSSLKVTQFELLLALFGYVVNRYSNQSDVLISTPEHGRHHSELQHIVGCFINTVVTRITHDESLLFRQYLIDTAESSRQALSHSHVGLEQLIDIVEPARNTAAMPISQLLFNYQSELSAVSSLSQKNAVVEEFGDSHSTYDLSLHIVEQQDRLVLNWQYASHLFKPSSIEQMSNALAYVYEQLDSLLDKNCQSINFPHVITKYSLPSENWLGIVERQLFSQAASIVLEDENYQLTGQQVLTEVNYISAQIKQHVQTGQTIAVSMEKSVSNVLALLAIQVAKCIYLPIDPTLPEERKTYIVNSAKVSLMLSDSTNHTDTVNFTSLLIKPSFTRPIQSEVWGNIQSTETAYCLFTSGSTGKPKGVEISHAALSNFLQAAAKRFTNSKLQALSVTTISFDISLMEMLLPLYQGGMVYIAKPHQVSFGHQINKLVETRNLNFIQTTPSRWQTWSDTELTPMLDVTFLSGGEALSTSLAQKLTGLSNHVYNCYGPTEATIWSMIAKVESDKTEVYIQNSLENYQHLVLNANDGIQPLGAKGELAIIGKSLANGYLNNEILSQEKFISLASDTRVYKTGDQVRELQPDCFQFLGRLDNQVKIRGHRVELGEIERVLILCPGVQEVAVKMFDQTLVCYYRLEPYADLYLLKQHSHGALPHYMQPSIWQSLSTFPVTSAGKVDYKSLNKPQNTETFAVVLPSTETESALLELWQQLLKPKSFGIKQDFFELGGNSLIAVTLINKVNDIFGLDLGIRVLFDAPTIESLAQFISAVLPAQNDFEYEEEGFL
jgi:amino acid adenylation domain-containing protein